MLYISRFYDKDRFGVVDTDDGVEEIATYSDLLRACDKNVQIGGVVKDDTITALDGGPVIRSIDIWEGLRPRRRDAAKLRTLVGVDIRVYKEYISLISWEPNRIVSPVSLRLSDYGSILADRAFYKLDGLDNNPHKVTLIFDDKISIMPNAIRYPMFVWPGIGGLGVVFDLREVTDSQIVSTVYSALKGFPSYFRGQNVDSVLDNPERLKRWKTYIAG